MKGFIIFLIVLGGSTFLLNQYGILPALLGKNTNNNSPITTTPNNNSNNNNTLNTQYNSSAVLVSNNSPKAPLNDIDPKKYHNFFQEGIVKEGSLYRWHKSDLTYYIDKIAARRLSESKIRRAFDWWAKKSRLFTFTRVTNPDKADIYIRVATASEKDRMGEAGPDRTQAGNTYQVEKYKLDEKIIMHASVTIAEEFFSAKQVEEYTRAGADHGFQTLVHELGHVLGLMGHSPNEGECMYFQADNSGKACDVLTPEINTLAMLYGRSDLLTRGFYETKRTGTQGLMRNN